MKFEVGFLNRTFSNKNSHNDNQYIFFAFKTDLQNFYYDFQKFLNLKRLKNFENLSLVKYKNW